MADNNTKTNQAEDIAHANPHRDTYSHHDAHANRDPHRDPYIARDEYRYAHTYAYSLLRRLLAEKHA